MDLKIWALSLVVTGQNRGNTKQSYTMRRPWVLCGLYFFFFQSFSGFLACQALETPQPLSSERITLASAQGTPVSTEGVGPLSMQEAIDLALKNYPSIREAEYRADAAKADVALSKTQYLPNVSLFSQLNRATDNKVQSTFFPQLGLNSISGPAKRTADLRSAWFSAVGTFVSWEPFDFGLRRANVQVAQAGVAQANAHTELTRFEVAARAADAYMKLLAAFKLVVAAHANIERMQVLETFVNDLVKAGLRPGADASRVEADLAAAQTSLARAEEQVALNRISLAQTLGLPGKLIKISGENMLNAPTIPDVTETLLTQHPLLREEQSHIDVIKGQEVALARSGLPRFSLLSTLNERGSGLDQNANFKGGADGLLPNHLDMMVGFLMNYSLTERIALREQKKAAKAGEQAEMAKYDAMLQEITAKRAQSDAQLQAALRIEQDTPIQLKAAQTAELQIRTRYKAGLADIVDVAEAQRLLTQAEVDDAIAKLDVWSALLGGAVAQGDLKPFIQLLSAQPAKASVKGRP